MWWYYSNTIIWFVDAWYKKGLRYLRPFDAFPNQEVANLSGYRYFINGYVLYPVVYEFFVILSDVIARLRHLCLSLGHVAQLILQVAVRGVSGSACDR